MLKNAFLNGYITEEVYVEQLPYFEVQKFSNHVFKLTKALYRVWHGRCKTRDYSNEYINKIE